MEQENKNQITELSTAGLNFKIFKSSVLISFVFHIVPILLILMIPLPPKTEIILSNYRMARPQLSPIRVPKAQEPPATTVKKAEIKEDRGSLIAMMGSRKKIKGFVRNLFYSNSTTIDFGGAGPAVDDSLANASAGKGLFSKIENAPSKVKRQELREIGPMFASIQGSSRVTKEEKDINFAESGLDIENPQIEGTLTSDAISKTVSSGEGVLRYCYEEALIRKPQIKGRIVVLFKVSENGLVESISIESSSLDDKPLEDCISRRVKTWRFPKPEGGTATIRYPFVFYTTSK